MAEDINLDDDGNLDEFDFDEFEFDNPSIDMEDREPAVVMRESAIDTLGDTDNLKRWAAMAGREALPDGFKVAFDEADDLVDFVKDGYEQTVKELKVPVNEFRNSVADMVENSGLISEGFKKKIAFIRPPEEADPVQVAQIEAQNAQTAAIDAALAGLNSPQRNRSNSVVNELYATIEESKLKASSKADYTQSKLLAEVVKNTGKLYQFKETVDGNYFRKSLELQFKQYFVAVQSRDVLKAFASDAVDTLKRIGKNSSLPDWAKSHLSENYQEIATQNLFGRANESLNSYTSGFTTKIKDNAKGKLRSILTSVKSGLQDSTGMLDEVNTASEMLDAETGSAIAGEEAANWLASKVAKGAGGVAKKLGMRNDKISDASEYLLYLSENKPQALNELRDKFYNTPFIGDLLSLIPSFGGEGLDIVQNLKEKGTEAVPLDFNMHRSIVEIIPGYLSRILEQATITNGGSGRVGYDIHSESFGNLNDIANSAKERIIGASSKRQAVNAEKFIQTLDPEEKLAQGDRVEFARILASKSGTNELFSMENLESWVNSNDRLSSFVEDMAQNTGGRKLRKYATAYNQINEGTQASQEEINALNASGGRDILEKANLIKIKGDGKATIDQEEILSGVMRNYGDKRAKDSVKWMDEYEAENLARENKSATADFIANLFNTKGKDLADKAKDKANGVVKGAADLADKIKTKTSTASQSAVDALNESDRVNATKKNVSEMATDAKQAFKERTKGTVIETAMDKTSELVNQSSDYVNDNVNSFKDSVKGKTVREVADATMKTASERYQSIKGKSKDVLNDTSDDPRKQDISTNSIMSKLDALLSERERDNLSSVDSTETKDRISPDAKDGFSNKTFNKKDSLRYFPPKVPAKTSGLGRFMKAVDDFLSGAGLSGIPTEDDAITNKRTNVNKPVATDPQADSLIAEEADETTGQRLTKRSKGFVSSLRNQLFSSTKDKLNEPVNRNSNILSDRPSDINASLDNDESDMLPKGNVPLSSNMSYNSEEVDEALRQATPQPRLDTAWFKEFRDFFFTSEDSGWALPVTFEHSNMKDPEDSGMLPPDFDKGIIDAVNNASNNISAMLSVLATNTDPDALKQRFGMFGRTKRLLAGLGKGANSFTRTYFNGVTKATGALASGAANIIGATGRALFGNGKGGDNEGEEDGTNTKRGNRFRRLAVGLGKGAVNGATKFTSAYFKGVTGLTGALAKGAKDVTGAAFGGASKLVGGIFGSGTGDIFLGKSAKDPVLYAYKLKEGRYVDSGTGKVIKKIKDITGDVLDDTGNVVVSKADINKFGLYQRNGIAGKLFKLPLNILRFNIKVGNGIVSFGRKLITGTFKSLTDRYPYDVYVGNEKTPRLLKVIFENNGYYSVATGKVISHPSKIDGEVKDKQGNIVITANDIKLGLTSVNGIKVGSSRLFSGTRKAISDTVRGIGNIAKSGLRAMGGLFGKKEQAKKDDMAQTMNDIYSFMVKRWGGTDLSAPDFPSSGPSTKSDVANKMNSVLDKIATNTSKDKPKFGDVDGDGDVEGSFKDMMQKRNADNGITDESVDGMQPSSKEEKSGGLFGMFKMLASPITMLIGGVSSFLAFGKNLLGTITTGIGWVRKLITLFTGSKALDAMGGGGVDVDLPDRDGKKTKGRTSTSRRGGRFGKVVNGAKDLFKGNASKSASRIAGKTAASTVGRTIASTAGRVALGVGAEALAGGSLLATGASAVGAGLATAAGAVGAVLASPVVIAGLAVGAAGFLGYNAYKYMFNHSDPEPLEKLRFMQYGIDTSDSDELSKIRQLESEFIDKVSWSNDQPVFKTTEEEVADDIASIYDVTPDDVNAYKQWSWWFYQRVTPILLNHLTALRLIDKGSDLDDVDDDLDVKKKPAFLDAVTTKAKYKGSNPLDIPLLYDGTNINRTAIDAYIKTLRDSYSDSVDKTKKETVTPTSPTTTQPMGNKPTDPTSYAELRNANMQKVIDAHRKRKEKYELEYGDFDKSSKHKVAETNAAPQTTRVITQEEVRDKAHESAAKAGIYLEEKATISNKDYLLPTVGRLSGLYGARRHPVTGKMMGHKGIDIAAPEGSPIVAAQDGTIFRKYKSRSYGNVIYMTHPDGKQTRYAHMSRFGDYANGDTVKRGETIGYVGSTGISTGPHLHYEMRNGYGQYSDAVDPLQFVGTKVNKEVKEIVKNAKGGDDDSDNGKATLETTLEGQTFIADKPATSASNASSPTTASASTTGSDTALEVGKVGLNRLNDKANQRTVPSPQDRSNAILRERENLRRSSLEQNKTVSVEVSRQLSKDLAKVMKDQTNAMLGKETADDIITIANNTTTMVKHLETLIQFAEKGYENNGSRTAMAQSSKADKSSQAQPAKRPPVSMS